MDGNLDTKVTGGTLTAAEWIQVPREIENVFTSMGIPASGSILTQLAQGISGYSGAATQYQDSGVADAYSLSPIGSKQAIHALNADHDGMLIRFRPGNANTGASTVNVNALGLLDIVHEDGGVLVPGDIVTTRDSWLRYDDTGTRFYLLTFTVPGAIDVPSGYVDGFITSADVADTDNDLIISAGICRDSTNTDTIVLSSPIIKQIDVIGGWIAGTNNAGVPAVLNDGANGVFIDTWYHVFVIKNPTNGLVDIGFDTSPTAVNLLAEATGYTLFRRIGSIRTTSTRTIKPYYQFGDHFSWQQPESDINISNPGTASVQHTLTSALPPDFKVLADVTVVVKRANSATLTFYSVMGNSPNVPASGGNGHDMTTILTSPGSNGAQIQKRVFTASAPQRVFTRQTTSDSSASLDIRTNGWTDPRGRSMIAAADPY